MAERYVVIDFETNGFSDRKARCEHFTLPWQNHPCQLSVDVVEDGETWHAFDTLIRGATRFSKWSKENLSFTVEEANERGVALEEAVQRLADLLTPGTILVAHNIQFDLEQCLARTVSRMGSAASPELVAALQKVLAAPRFCTLRCEHSKIALGNMASLGALCKHFQVDYLPAAAHDATYDATYDEAKWSAKYTAYGATFVTTL